MKILIIDDDVILTEILSLMLRPTASAVFIAHSGVDGIKFIHEQSPDLVILDTMLPDMDGVHVCKAVREFSSVPILILSGLDTPSVIVEAKKSGADDYLAKPVALHYLLARIDQLVQRSDQEEVLLDHLVPA
jgi:DNA-binding response OmpR family regulator